MNGTESTWKAAVRLAITLSVVGAVAAATLSGVLSQTSIVLGVIVVGFVTSWVRTGQVHGQRPIGRHHRVVTVPVRRVHFPVN